LEPPKHNWIFGVEFKAWPRVGTVAGNKGCAVQRSEMTPMPRARRNPGKERRNAKNVRE